MSSETVMTSLSENVGSGPLVRSGYPRRTTRRTFRHPDSEARYALLYNSYEFSDEFLAEQAAIGVGIPLSIGMRKT